MTAQRAREVKRLLPMMRSSQRSFRWLCVEWRALWARHRIKTRGKRGWH